MPRGPSSKSATNSPTHQTTATPSAAAIVETRGGVVSVADARGLLGGGLGIFGVVAMFPLLAVSDQCPRAPCSAPTGRRYVPRDISGRRLHVGDLAIRFARDRLPGRVSRTATADSGGPDGAIRISTRTSPPKRAAKPGPRGLPRLLEAVHPPGLSGGLLRTGTGNCSCVRAISRCSTSPTARIPQFGPRRGRCPIAAVRGRERVSSLTARLLRTGGSGILGARCIAGMSSRRPRHQARPAPSGRTLRQGRQRDHERTTWVSARAVGRSWTRSSPITGPSCR